jgi:UDP-N-acetylmuramate dehydrogenase
MIEIKKDVSLKAFNTFGVDVKTSYLANANRPEKVLFTLNYASYNQLPIRVLGGGSNVLFTSDFEGITIQPSIPGITIIDDQSNEVIVKVGAGVNWDSLVAWSVERNLGGVENLSMIPGSVGASPIQNIGAYGVEVKDSIVKVEGININSRKPFELYAAECRFGYRDSIFKNELKGKVVITYVWFKLLKNPTLVTHYGNLEEELTKLGTRSVKTVREAVISIRRGKLPDPAELGNAGSFFKNPVVDTAVLEGIRRKHENVPTYAVSDAFVKIPAGWLIEKCGWKGKRIGNCGVHKDQALIIVNYGNATGREILTLAEQIRKSVLDEFGIAIEMEVNVL